MISRYHVVGNKVRFTDTGTGELGASFGDIGTITEVDPSDHVMTYRVQFPGANKAYWHLNQNLEAVLSENEPVCGWREVALRTMAELEELKYALKALSEV